MNADKTQTVLGAGLLGAFGAFGRWGDVCANATRARGHTPGSTGIRRASAASRTAA
jgi:hypothetical protein